MNRSSVYVVNVCISRYPNVICMGVGEVNWLELEMCPQCKNSTWVTFLKHFVEIGFNKYDKSRQFYICFECGFKSAEFSVIGTDEKKEIKSTKDEVKVIPIRTVTSKDVKFVNVSFEIDRSVLFDILDLLESKGIKESIKVKSVG